MLAHREIVGLQVLVEVGVRLRVDLIAVVNVLSFPRVLLVEFLGHQLEFGLAAAVIAHQDDGLEPADQELLRHFLVDHGEGRGGEADGAGELGARAVG